jgi:hypothetical protein
LVFVVGINEPDKGFYRRIFRYFMDNSLNSNMTQNSVSLRWGAIQKAVSKFSNIFSMVCRNECDKTEKGRALVPQNFFCFTCHVWFVVPSHELFILDKSLMPSRFTATTMNLGFLPTVGRCYGTNQSGTTRCWRSIRHQELRGTKSRKRMEKDR